jgi:hypothetical protein
MGFNHISTYDPIVHKQTLGANKHLQGNDDIHERLVRKK